MDRQIIGVWYADWHQEEFFSADHTSLFFSEKKVNLPAKNTDDVGASFPVIMAPQSLLPN